MGSSQELPNCDLRPLWQQHKDLGAGLVPPGAPELSGVGVETPPSAAVGVLPSAAGVFTCGTAAKVASHLFLHRQIPINVFFSPCSAKNFWPFWFLCVFEQTERKRKEGEGPTSCLGSLLMSLFLLTA